MSMYIIHININVHLYIFTIYNQCTLIYNTVRNKENSKHRKEVKIMKRTKSMIYKASDEAYELFLYATNEGSLYRQQIENLKKKVAKGTYDADKAADLFYYAADRAAKMYNQNFGGKFTVQQRFTAAVDMVEFYDDLIHED